MAVRQATITIDSRWGMPTTHLLETHPHASGLAVIFPGSNYPVDAPLLRFARMAALEDGFDVLSLEYSFQTNRREMQQEGLPTLVDEALHALNAVPLHYQTIVLVSKSLGTVIGSQVQQRLSSTLAIHHHIFLTPLAPAIDGIRRTNHAMVVVGTKDLLFDADQVELVSQLTSVELHKVQNANHALEVESYPGSLQILQDVTKWCADFLRSSL